jgi:riboflavin kinase/FMN adenylyltransferase
MVSTEQPGAGVIAAIGNFDGVHLGHQYLLRETDTFAREKGAKTGAVVFDPHPRRYFRPEDPPFLITLPETRDALLKQYGAEKVLPLTFDKELASLSPEEFIRAVLKDKLGLSGVVVGADFQFGQGRAGNSEMLKSLGEAAGLYVHIVKILSEASHSEKFGSSAIRDALSEGSVRRAADMLGRPWSVTGRVVEGQKLGRTIGFPTANITLGDLIEPRKGVYVTRAIIGGKAYDAVSNYGRRPTVGASDTLLETHLFDFSGDLYEQEIEVIFIDFLRDERKFENIEALKEQINADCKKARAKHA